VASRVLVGSDTATEEVGAAAVVTFALALALSELCAIEDIALFTASEPASGPSAGGSNGKSTFGASSSECEPTGRRGRRKVPLFGFGVIPSESQTML
jgi:hypothetical protein